MCQIWWVRMHIEFWIFLLIVNSVFITNYILTETTSSYLGYKPRQYGQGGSYNNGYVGKYNNGQGGSYNNGKQKERYNPWQAYH